MIKWLENLWYHHKAILLITAAVLICGVYLRGQMSSSPEPDYYTAIVSPDYYPDEQLYALQEALRAAGTDRNGDGTVTVQLKTYHVALGADGQDINEIGALDADLSGKVSALFLLADADAFEAATNGILSAAECVPGESCTAISGTGFEGLFAAIRPDHKDADDYTCFLS